MAEDVNLPGGLKAPRKGILIGGVIAVGVLGYLWWRNRTSAATAAPTDTTGADTTDTTGLDALDGQGATGADASAGAVGSVFSQPAATTNAQWSANVVAALDGIVDPTALSAALGAYLTGGVPTVDQENLIDQAIAAAGYPPVAGPAGYPPGIRAVPSGATGQTNPVLPVGSTGTGSSDSGGTSSTGGGSTTPAPKPAPKPATKTVKYTVKSGDDLDRIAAKYKVTESALYAKNKTVIEAAAKKHGLSNSDNGHWIYAGTILVIP